MAPTESAAGMLGSMHMSELLNAGDAEAGDTTDTEGAQGQMTGLSDQIQGAATIIGDALVASAAVGEEITPIIPKDVALEDFMP